MSTMEPIGINLDKLRQSRPSLFEGIPEGTPKDETMALLLQKLEVLSDMQKTRNEPTTPITVQIPVSLRDKLVAIVKSNRGISRKKIVNEGINMWIEKNYKTLPEDWERVAQEHSRAYQD